VQTTAAREFSAGGLTFSANPTRTAGNSSLLFDEILPVGESESGPGAFDGSADVVVRLSFVYCGPVCLQR
jgi:hypothetical protein